MKTIPGTVVEVKLVATSGGTDYVINKNFVLPVESASPDDLKECKLEAMRLALVDRDYSKISIEVRSYPCMLMQDK